MSSPRFIIQKIAEKKFNVAIINSSEGEIGKAKYMQDDDGAWIAWVGVSEKFRKKGLATEALIVGDEYIRTNFPSSKRRFKNNRDTLSRYRKLIPSDANEEIDGQVYSWELNKK